MTSFFCMVFRYIVHKCRKMYYFINNHNFLVFSLLWCLKWKISFYDLLWTFVGLSKEAHGKGASTQSSCMAFLNRHHQAGSSSQNEIQFCNQSISIMPFRINPVFGSQNKVYSSPYMEIFRSKAPVCHVFSLQHLVHLEDHHQEVVLKHHFLICLAFLNFNFKPLSPMLWWRFFTKIKASVGLSRITKCVIDVINWSFFGLNWLWVDQWLYKWSNSMTDEWWPKFYIDI